MSCSLITNFEEGGSDGLLHLFMTHCIGILSIVGISEYEIVAYLFIYKYMHGLQRWADIIFNFKSLQFKTPESLLK